MSGTNRNLGNMSIVDAQLGGEVLYRCWREHNTALLFAEFLNSQITEEQRMEIILFDAGVKLEHVLTFMLSLSDLFPQKHILDKRERFMNKALELNWDEQAVLRCAHELLVELLEVLKDNLTYTRQKNVVTDLKVIVSSFINHG